MVMDFNKNKNWTLDNAGTFGSVLINLKYAIS